MTKTAKPFERLFHTIAKHPYLCVTAACILTIPFGMAQTQNLNIGSLFYAAAVCAALMALIVFGGQIGQCKHDRLIFFFGGVIFCGITLFMFGETGYSSVILLFMPLILIAGIAVLIHFTGALSTRNLIILMVAAGVVLRLVYILYTGSDERQHDVSNWSGAGGHSSFILYWYTNGLKLPDFDVRSLWQYYHPPLHHWLMAALLRIYTLLGIDFDTAKEGLQILPMLYSSLTMMVCYRIFRMVKLSRGPLVAAMALICFHPTFVLMGGSFNNDMLSVLFMLGAMMWALRWYRKPTIKIIVPIALCVGLGMMTKLSAWMVAPAIAALFLCALLRHIRKPGKLIGQFALFGVICAPLALWWQVRNLITFNVPLTYVPYLGNTSDQYLGRMSVAHRLFDFSGRQLGYVFEAFTYYGAPYNEFNPTLGLIKTSLFDEGSNGISTINFPQLQFIGPALFWVAIPLIILATIAFFVAMFSKKTAISKAERLFFLLSFVMMLGSYYLFCFVYPFTCTMNIRYCVPIIPLTAMGLGLLLQTRRSKLLHAAAYTLTAVFCTLSAVLFTMIN